MSAHVPVLPREVETKYTFSVRDGVEWVRITCRDPGNVVERPVQEQDRLGLTGEMARSARRTLGHLEAEQICAAYAAWKAGAR
jgi:hypothetical protein